MKLPNFNSPAPECSPRRAGSTGRQLRPRFARLAGTAALALTSLAATLAPQSAQAFPTFIGNCCSNPNQVTPTGTIYAGDDLTFVKLMNQDYSGLHCESQISTTGNSNFTANQMTYSGSDSGNSVWKFTRKFAAGTVWFYHDGWEDFSGSHIFDNNSGNNYTTSITALVDPSGQTATQNSSTQINLAWTRGVSGVAKNTMILRNTTGTFTAPTQGTAYSVGTGTGPGGADVVYNSSGTSFNDTGRSIGTKYFYKFYAESFSYYSAGVTASACTTPTIATQPTDQVVCTASNATFTLTANGSGVTYKWRKNGTNINDGATGNGSTYSGTTTATLTITGAVAGDAASAANGYDCVVTDFCSVGAATSNRVALTVTASIVINTQPTAQTACSSPGTASYTIAVTAASPTYQWRLNGVNLSNGANVSGATTATLSLSNLTSANTVVAGSGYDCVVSSACGSPVTSSRVALTVSTVPAITVQPTAQTACSTPGTASYSVTATGDGLTYQWRLNGATLSNGANVSGATTSTLSLSNLTSANTVVAGSGYDVVVSGTSPCAAATSNRVALTVNTVPAITAQPTAQTVCSTPGTASYSVTATGTGPTYQWRLNGATLSNGANVSGATTATLSLSNLTSANTVAAGSGYDVMVSGTSPCAAATSNRVALTVNTSAGVTLNHATSTICATSTESVTATRSGSATGGTWTSSSGNSPGFSSTTADATTYTPSATDISNGTVTLTFTTSGQTSPCGAATATDTVTINPASVGGTATAASSTLLSGSTTTVTVTGNTGSSIQWQQSADGSTGWANVTGGSGATTATYTTPALTTTTYYRAQITSGVCSAAFSSVATVTVGTGASSTNPSNQSACNGSTATFSVTGSGTAPLSYSWSKRSNAGWGSAAWSVTGNAFRGSATGNDNNEASCTTFSPTGHDINSTSGNALGMFGTSTATRSIPAISTYPTVISVDMDNGSVDTGQQSGFVVQDSSNTSILKFYFQGGGTDYLYAINGGTAQDTGIGFLRQGLRVKFVLTSATTYKLLVTPCGGTTREFNGTYSGTLANLKLFSNNTTAGAVYDLFFNNFQVGGYVDDADNYTGTGSFTGLDKGDAPIGSGNGSSTYTTPTLNSGNNGDKYQVVTQNAYGSFLSGAATLTVDQPPTTATVGSNQSVCGLTSSALGGNTPSVGTGAWSKFSGPGNISFSASTSGSSTATADAYGTYVLRWTISNGTCTPSTADVTVLYSQPPTTATVGSDQNVCGLTSGSLGGNTPSVGTGAWSKFSGPGNISFSNSASGSSTATADAYGTYVLSWTISNGTCTASIAHITITYDQAPTTATVGSNQSVCGLTSTALGGNTPSVGTATWSKVSGPGNISFSNNVAGSSTATADAYGTYVLRWTISNGTCTPSTADVTVVYSNTPTTATVGSNQSVCGLTSSALGGNTPSVGTGAWSKVSGPGNISFSDSTSGSSTATADAYGSYVLRWTISNGTCTASTADVTVVYSQIPTAPTASAQTFCSADPHTVANLTATGSGGTIKWYDVASGGTALTGSTVLTTGTYYVSETSGAGCESSRTSVSVTVNTTPGAPTGSASQTFCSTNSHTVGDLAATGTLIKWYSTSSGGTALSGSTTLVDGATYYASDTVNGCESTSRFAVTVTLTQAGVIAGADSATRPAGSSDFKILLTDLLTNDLVKDCSGATVSSDLSVTGVTAGTDNNVEIAGPYVIYEPVDATASADLTFTYTVHDSISNSDATGTVTVHTGAATPFTLDIVAPGTPVYNSGNDTTTVTVDLISVPNTNLNIEWSTNLTTWTATNPATTNTGPSGSFSLTITVPGNPNAYFFRATK